MERQGFWTYENKLVTLFFFSIGFVFFDRLAINFLMPFMQKDFGLSYAQIGLLGSALALTWTIAGPIGGYISDRAKSKKTVLALFVIGFSVVSLAHGLAASFAMLLMFRLLMGFVEGPITPITQSVLAIESSEKRRGFNMGITMNTGNAIFGSFLAPLVIVALATAFDWRTAFYLTIIPGIILAICIMTYMKDPKKELTKEAEYPALSGKGGVKEVIKHKNIWITTIVFSCFMVYVMGFNIFAPVFIVQVKGFTESTMAIVMAAFGAGFALFGFIVPAISDRIGRKPAALIFGIFSIFTPLAILYVDSLPLLAAIVFLCASGMGVGSLVMSNIPAESVPLKFAGLAVGITIGIGELVGGFFNPILSGMAADVWGPAAPLFIASGGATAAFLISLFLKETAPIKVRADADSSATTTAM